MLQIFQSARTYETLKTQQGNIKLTRVYNIVTHSLLSTQFIIYNHRKHNITFY